ncbi:MAG: 50S ribosomal protein L18 [Bdellovibrionaceae bacterium]|nr:50S ribosomal protein L18 [Pseudobdellovibrionaceae bacterium]
MKVLIKKSYAERLSARLAKKVRIRKKIKGTAEQPRLCFYRSLSNVYAQLIDDVNHKTILSVSSLGLDKKASLKNMATEVGKLVAQKAVAAKITNVVFDRNGFIYHGRVKAFADAARENGLKF